MRNANFASCALECSSRGVIEDVFTIFGATNLYDNSHPIKSVLYLPDKPLPASDLWNPSDMIVNWQETSFRGTPYSEATRNLLHSNTLDFTRIRVEGEAEFKMGNFSEMHTNVFIREIKCCGQAGVGLIAISRFARADVPKPKHTTVAAFQFFVNLLGMLIGPVERVGVEDIITKEQYMPYLKNMPELS